MKFIKTKVNLPETYVRRFAIIFTTFGLLAP